MKRFDLTEEELKELTAKHKYLKVAVVQDGDASFEALFKDPTENTIKACNAMEKKGDDTGSVNVLYEDCVIAADQEIKDNYIYRTQVAKLIATRLTEVKASVKNY